MERSGFGHAVDAVVKIFDKNVQGVQAVKAIDKDGAVVLHIFIAILIPQLFRCCCLMDADPNGTVAAVFSRAEKRMFSQRRENEKNVRICGELQGGAFLSPLENFSA